MDEVRGMKVEIRGNDLVFTRSFKAPRPLVYKAWTNAEYLAQWFGPHGFFCPECSVDLRVGGEFNVTMQGADGELHRMEYKLLVVAENEKLVIVDDSSDLPEDVLRQVNEFNGISGDTAIELQWTILFEDEEGGTKLTLVTHAYSAEGKEQMLRRGDAEGWAMIMEKLDSVLTRMLYQTP